MSAQVSTIKNLKGLFIGRRSFPKRLLLAFLPSLAISFTLFFFGPLDLVYVSGNNLSYSPLQILPVTAGIMAAAFAFLLLAASVPGGKVHAFLVSMYTGIAAALYFQGALLNPDFGSMDGNTVNWPSFSTMMLINLAVWLAILLIPHLLHYFSNRYWRFFVMVLSTALILMQAVSLGTKLGGRIKADRAAPEKYHISLENMLRVGKQKNIIVFLLDTVSNQDLSDMLDKHPDSLSLFHDFTRYDNANSHYMYTVPSLVNLLTGQEWDCENVHISDYMNSAWQTEQSTSFFEKLAEKGYERNIYMLLPEAAKDPAVLKDVFSNLKPSGSNYSIDKGALVKLIKLSFYRYFPLMMKPFFVIYTSDIGNLVKRPDAMENEWDFVMRMNESSLSTGNSDNAFFFYYLQGSHLPYRMDERGRMISSDLAPEFNTNYSEMEDQLAGFFYLISEYIRQLKGMGLYDQAGIIILADHGNNIRKDADRQPIYLTKMPGEKHDAMILDPAQITIQDCFQADVIEMTGEDGQKWGIPSKQFPDEPVERWSCAYGKDDSFPALSGSRYNVIREYRYTGDGGLLTDYWNWGRFETVPMLSCYY